MGSGGSLLLAVLGTKVPWVGKVQGNKKPGSGPGWFTNRETV
jgi:hypothetical protein